MEGETPPENRQLERIEKMVRKLLSSVITIESRVAIIHQEFQRNSTNQHRFAINQEALKLAANRHEHSLRALAEEVAILRNMLSEEDTD